MEKLIIGTSALENANTQLMRTAGIGWVRAGFPFPFSDRCGGTLTDEYLQAKQAAEAWLQKDFLLLGVTPGLGIATYQPDPSGRLRMVWKNGLPDWVGLPGSEDYYRMYAEACSFLAGDLEGIVPVWQIANELDIPQFAGPLNLYQASELILRAAAAMKATDSSLLVSTNAAGNSTSYFFFGRLFHDARISLDYCGIDQYYGSWQEGGPDRWAERIAELYAITGTPILVNEWGFSSAGEYMSQDELKAFQAGTPPCQFQKWIYSWGEGHNRLNQAEYVRQAFDIFIAHREKLIGICFYRWEDQAACWQCGSPKCPIETAWGLVDIDNQPKPSYQAFK